jgi:hypothetical protein
MKDTPRVTFTLVETTISGDVSNWRPPNLSVEAFCDLLSPFQRYIHIYATTQSGPPQLAAGLG